MIDLPERLKPWSNLIRIGILLLLVVLSLYLVRFLFWLFAPFILAWLLSLFMRPFINLFERRLRLSRSLNVFLSMLLVLIAGLLLAFHFFNWLFSKAKYLSLFFPLYLETVEEQGALALARIRELTTGLSPKMAVLLEDGIKDLGDSIARLVNQALQYVLQLSFNLPDIVIIVVVAIVAAYYYSIDRERVESGLARLIPVPWRGHVRNALHETGSAFRALLRAQVILFGVAFLQLLLGFWLLGLKNWFTLGVLVLIVDLLPIVGTGVVLLPWMIWSLLIGKTLFGLGLLLLYLVIVVTRNLISPRLYAQSYGLDALSTLIAMYVGLKLIGFWGLFLSPLLLMIYLIFYRVLGKEKFQT